MSRAESARKPAAFADDRLSLVTKVAKLYHESHLRQPEISERLNLSQSRVSRLLKQAVDEGIVRTVVVSPEGLYSDLEQALADRYGLIDVAVADVLVQDEPSLLAALGATAAAYLQDTLNEHERLGISSWSASLLATVNSMSPPATVRLASEVVQVLGGVGRPDVQVQATHLTDQLARVTGGVPKFFPAPGIVGSSAARSVLMDDRYLGSLSTEWVNLTTVLAGIGALLPSPLLASSGNAVDSSETAFLEGAGAVGDVCLRFFDERGDPVATELDDRILGISREALLGVPRRIGVAGGERKYAAIRGAVLGGWVNILVTDKDTAVKLLEEPADEQDPEARAEGSTT
ncbi:sugar-binding transcriptional regulator [Gryllotalpicola koreensis]|uniref:Sugar-binding transcriptional regulator n=1 Tax=Gryllotalpicola koreensis TaxID=993086 RepID=A0ABP7ZTB0_9MICO